MESHYKINTPLMALNKAGYHTYALSLTQAPTNKVCKKKDAVFTGKMDTSKTPFFSYDQYKAAFFSFLKDKNISEKELISETGTSAYNIPANGRRGLLKGQQAGMYKRKNSSNVSFAYLFTMGSYMLLLLKVFIELARVRKQEATDLAMLMKEATDASTEKEYGVSATKGLTDLLMGAKTGSQAIPDVDDANIKSYAELGLKISRATNDDKYKTEAILKKVDIKKAQDLFLFAQTQKNRVDLIKNTVETDLNKKQSDASSAYKNFTDALSTISRVWKRMART